MKIPAVLGIALLSFVATFATTCIQRPVHSREEMENHWTGYPIAFIRQDIRRYDPQTFPEYFRLDSPLKSPKISLEVERFLASWAIVFAGALACVWGFKAMLRRMKKQHAT